MSPRATSAFALATVCALSACTFDWPPTTPPYSPIPAYPGPDSPQPKTKATGTAAAPPLSKAQAMIAYYLDQALENEPSMGRYLGIHQFDGKVAGYSRAAIEKRIAFAAQQRAELGALDKADLSPDEALDVALLVREADLFLFRHNELAEWRNRPQYYSDLFDVSGYLERDYASLEERGKRLLVHERAALAEVPHIRENLESPMPKRVVETAVKIYKGYAEYLRGDVVKQLKGVGGADFQAEFAATNEKLAAEADKFATYLKTVELPKGDDSYVLGPDRYKRLLLVQEGLTIPLAEFKKMGEDNLARNKKDYEALAPKTKLTRTTSEGVLGDATKLVDRARQFILDKKLVTIPTEERAIPKESPPFMRWNSAFLNGPGPFEKQPLPAFYYITRPDPSWPKKEQEGYLMPLGVLLSTTIHETYPGHFLQGQWIKKAPTRAQKMLGAYSFIEGWAHYGEEMMIEEGFGADDPQNHLGQLSDALLRNCRFVVSLGVHTEKMTMAQAEKRFIDDCHQDKATAREQATRATFDPGYFAYTLGKIQILALREEAKQKLGAKFSLQRFHDALLAHGSAPVPLLHDRVIHDLVEAAK